MIRQTSLDLYTYPSRAAKLDSEGDGKEFLRPYRRVVGIMLGRSTLWACRADSANDYERSDAVKEKIAIPRLLRERVVTYFAKYYMRVAEVPALHSVVGIPEDCPYDFIEVKALDGNLALCSQADTEANTACRHQ